MGMPISLALRGRHAGDARGDAARADALEALPDTDASAGWQPADIARRSSYGRTGPAARSDVRPYHLHRTAAPPLPFIVGSATATANPVVPVNPAACCSYRSRT